MNFVNTIIDKYVKEKSFSDIFKASARIFCVLTISIFILDKLNISNYFPEDITVKAIYMYLHDGHFIAPAVVFYLVFALTTFLAKLVFYGVNIILTKLIKKHIILEEYSTHQLTTMIRKLNIATKKFKDTTIYKENLLEFYLQHRSSFNQSLIDSLAHDSKKSIENNVTNFIISFQIIIAATVYLSTNPSFFWIWFLIILLIAAWQMCLQLIAHSFLSLLPHVCVKLFSIAEQYLQELNYYPHPENSDNINYLK